MEEEIEEIEMDIDKVEKKGIKTKKHKDENEEEIKEQMKDIKKNRDEKLKGLKDDYMERIAKAKSPLEKERLLDEM